MNLGRSFVGFLVLSLMAGAVLWWGVSNGQAPSSQAAKAADEGLLEYERNTVEIVERYGDGVVYVSVVTRPQSVQLPPGFEFFAPFLQVPPQRGTGSGFVTSGATGSGRGTGGAGTLSLIPPGEPSAGASVAAKLSPSPATNSKIFVAGFDSKLFEYAASSSTATTRPWRTTEVTKAAGIRSLMVRGGSATKTAEATVS